MIEIERKFLTKNSDWKNLISYSQSLKQAYLLSSKEITLRVRTINQSEAFLTIKGKNLNSGLSREEFEYSIPFAEAEEMIKSFCRGKTIAKTRYICFFEGKRWEIDEFEGELAGLTVAEIELENENEIFAKPNWIGKEVTGDPAYYNAVLWKKINNNA